MPDSLYAADDLARCHSSAGMRAMVTGAGGFVGANLCRRLVDDGHDVTAVVSPVGEEWRLADLEGDLQLSAVDLCVRDDVRAAVERARPEWVFHLAAHGAYSWQRDAERIMQTNLVATVHLLESCREMGTEAFVNAGSSSEYGIKDHAPHEEEFIDPHSDYAVMKAAAAIHIRHVARRHDIHAVTLRLYSVYGPWEEPGRLMPTLAARGVEGRLPPLASPETPRDFVSVRDVSRAFVLAAERSGLERGSVVNIASGRQTSLREVVQIARAEFDISTEPLWGSEPQRDWDTEVWVGDAGRALSELAWRAEDDLTTGFRALGDWLRQRPDLWPRYGLVAPI